MIKVRSKLIKFKQPKYNSKHNLNNKHNINKLPNVNQYISIYLEDINSQLGYFNIGNVIGDPRFQSSSMETYPDLDLIRDVYFEKYITIIQNDNKNLFWNPRE